MKESDPHIAGAEIAGMAEMADMADMAPIVNKVAQSPIEVFNLEDLWDGGKVSVFDIASFLEHGLILREKPFRAAVAEHNWDAYGGQHVAVQCSTDAIVPVWAYMLVALRLDGIATSVSFGSADDLVREWFAEAITQFDWSIYEDAIVVVKGCGSGIVPESAYVASVQKLQRVARKLMFGEPCSSVPLWRRPKQQAAPPVSNTDSGIPRS